MAILTKKESGARPDGSKVLMNKVICYDDALVYILRYVSGYPVACKELAKQAYEEHKNVIEACEYNRIGFVDGTLNDISVYSSRDDLTMLGSYTDKDKMYVLKVFHITDESRPIWMSYTNPIYIVFAFDYSEKYKLLLKLGE